MWRAANTRAGSFTGWNAGTARAEKLNPGRVRFNHELLALEQDAAGVVATVRDKSAGVGAAAAARHVDLLAIRLGHLDGDWLDPRLAFLRLREFGPQGAILVRPDRVIGWRAMGARTLTAGADARHAAKLMPGTISRSAAADRPPVHRGHAGRRKR